MDEIKTDKIINKVCSLYENQNQHTVEIPNGDNILFLDCRFVHNEFTDRHPDNGLPVAVNRLSNFYIYEATLYKDGEFVPEHEWDFASDITEIEKEIFQRLTE